MNQSDLSYKLNPDLIESHGKAAIKFLTEHFKNIEQFPVTPNLKPGQLAAQFDKELSQQGKEFDSLLDEVKSKIIPGVTHWQHPQFLSYYPSASSVPAIYADLITAAIGSVGLQWSANPIGTELECVVMDWLMKMLHAESDSPFLHTSGIGGGLIQNTAGEALVVILTAARVHKQLELSGIPLKQLTHAQRQELYYADSSKLVAYMSDHTHFSGPKAARVAGIRLHTIPAKKLANGNYGITADQVKSAMQSDRQKGLIPCYVQLNYGSTNTCGYDDITSFQSFSSQQKIWLHVDAAYAGASLILSRFKQQSLEIQSVADSFNFNGSKWFLCGFDSAFLFVRDRIRLKDVFSATDEYMINVDKEESYNPEFKDWSVPLGRRFRALRIWMVLEYFGLTGMRSFIESSIQQADWLRNEIDKDKNFEQVATTDLGLVCLKPKKNKSVASLIQSLQSESDMHSPYLIYPSKLNGEEFIRIALGGVNTSLENVKQFWLMCQHWANQEKK